MIKEGNNGISDFSPEYYKYLASLSSEIHRQCLNKTGYQGSIRTNILTEELNDSTNNSYVTLEDGEYKRQIEKKDKVRVFPAAGMWVTDKGYNGAHEKNIGKINDRLDNAKNSFENLLNYEEKNAYNKIDGAPRFNKIFCSLITEGYPKEQHLNDAISNNKEIFNDKDIKVLYAPTNISRYFHFNILSLPKTIANTLLAKRRLIKEAENLIKCVSLMAEKIKKDGNYEEYDTIKTILNKRSPNKKDLKKISDLNNPSETFKQMATAAVAAKMLINSLNYFERKINNRTKVIAYLIFKFLYSIILYPLKLVFKTFNVTNWSLKALASNLNALTMLKKFVEISAGAALVATAPLIAAPIASAIGASSGIILPILYGIAGIMLFKALFVKEKNTNDHLSLLSLITLMNPATQVGCKTGRDRTGMFFALLARTSNQLLSGKKPTYDLNENFKENMENSRTAMNGLEQIEAYKHGASSLLLLHKKPSTLIKIILIVVYLAALTALAFTLTPALNVSFILPIALAIVPVLALIVIDGFKPIRYNNIAIAILFLLASIPLLLLLGSPSLDFGSVSFIFAAAISGLMFFALIGSMASNKELIKQLDTVDKKNKGAAPKNKLKKENELSYRLFKKLEPEVKLTIQSHENPDETVSYNSSTLFDKTNKVVYYHGIDGEYHVDLTNLHKNFPEDDKIKQAFHKQLDAVEKVTLDENNIEKHEGEINLYISERPQDAYNKFIKIESEDLKNQLLGKLTSYLNNSYIKSTEELGENIKMYNQKGTFDSAQLEIFLGKDIYSASQYLTDHMPEDDYNYTGEKKAEYKKALEHAQNAKLFKELVVLPFKNKYQQIEDNEQIQLINSQPIVALAAMDERESEYNGCVGNNLPEEQKLFAQKFKEYRYHQIDPKNDDSMSTEEINQYISERPQDAYNKFIKIESEYLKNQLLGKLTSYLNNNYIQSTKELGGNIKMYNQEGTFDSAQLEIFLGKDIYSASQYLTDHMPGDEYNYTGEKKAEYKKALEHAKKARVFKDLCVLPFKEKYQQYKDTITEPKEFQDEIKQLITGQPIVALAAMDKYASKLNSNIVNNLPKEQETFAQKFSEYRFNQFSPVNDDSISLEKLLNPAKLLGYLYYETTKLSEGQNEQDIKTQYELDFKRLFSTEQTEKSKAIEIAEKQELNAYDQGQAYLTNEVEEITGRYFYYFSREIKTCLSDESKNIDNELMRYMSEIFTGKDPGKAYINDKKDTICGFTVIRLNDFLRKNIAAKQPINIDIEGLDDTSHIVITCENSLLANGSEERASKTNYFNVTNHNDLDKILPHIKTKKAQYSFFNRIGEFSLASVTTEEFKAIKKANIPSINDKINTFTADNVASEKAIPFLTLQEINELIESNVITNNLRNKLQLAREWKKKAIDQIRTKIKEYNQIPQEQKEKKQELQSFLKETSIDILLKFATEKESNFNEYLITERKAEIPDNHNINLMNKRLDEIGTEKLTYEFLLKAMYYAKPNEIFEEMDHKIDVGRDSSFTEEVKKLLMKKENIENYSQGMFTLTPEMRMLFGAFYEKIVCGLRAAVKIEEKQAYQEILDEIYKEPITKNYINKDKDKVSCFKVIELNDFLRKALGYNIDEVPACFKAIDDQTTHIAIFCEDVTAKVGTEDRKIEFELIKGRNIENAKARITDTDAKEAFQKIFKKQSPTINRTQYPPSECFRKSSSNRSMSKPTGSIDQPSKNPGPK